MIHIYGMAQSGNCYKLKLMCELLGTPYQWTEVDIIHGESQTDSFLQKNPNGKVPVMELEDGRLLPESNAGLFYLAFDSEWLPAERYLQSQVLQWMFFEQYTHEPAIAVARFIKKFLPQDHPRNSELPVLHDKGYKALSVMEKHLQQNKFFVDNTPTIADIALFAYTHAAEDGGYDLERFPAVNLWLDRIKNLNGFIPM